jgi:tetratricopeptide (TPR) repeat protein
MADHVQKNMERMVPEFEEMQTSGLFSADEVSKIIKKRREHEYAMHRAGKELVDFLRAIEFELNLSYLIKNRTSRLQTLPKLAYPAVLGRLHQLFHSATKVFKHDVRLWLQYIDFTMRSNTGQAAGKIFAQALALQPNFVPFWISAASWEYFTNHNIQAARVILQRANRLNPQSQDVLLEYARLELAYREKVMARLDIFGVQESELKEAAVALEDLPKGESAVKGALERTAAEHEDKPSQKHKNPFFAGAIPLAVYQTAIKAFPQDLPLRMQFAHIIGSFADSESILDAVYASIEADFENPLAQAFIARRPYDNSPRPSKLKSPSKKAEQAPVERDWTEITNQTISSFESLLSAHPSVGLYEHYISFLLEVLSRVDENYSEVAQDPSKPQTTHEKPGADASLTTLLRKKISLVFKEAFANSFVSEQLSTKWIDFLLAVDRLDDALETAEKCAAALPSNPLLQTCYFSLVAQVSDLHKQWKSSQAAATPSKSASKKSKGSKEESDKSETDQSSVFNSAKLKKFVGWSHDEMDITMSKAMKKVDLTHPACGDLYILYWNHLLDSEKNVKSPDEDERTPEESLALAAAMNHYKRTLVSLKGEALTKFKRTTLASALSRWTDKSEATVAHIRAIYQAGLDSPPSDFQFYKMCINFETSTGTGRSVTLSRRLFEAAVSDFGTTDMDVWLSYIEWETALGQHANASQLFTRAKRTLKNPDAFIHEYTKKLDSEFNSTFSAT